MRLVQICEAKILVKTIAPVDPSISDNQKEPDMAKRTILLDAIEKELTGKGVEMGKDMLAFEKRLRDPAYQDDST